MPEIQIRPAITSEFPRLAQIEHHGKSDYVWQMERLVEESQISIAFRQVRLPRTVKVDYPYPVDGLPERFNQQTILLAAILQGDIVGYIAVEERAAAGTAWVGHLAVSQRFRRQGIASALVLASQSWAQRRGLRRMVMVTHSKNAPAIRMALKLGFEFSGYHDQYYANQDIALFFTSLLR
ncbi:MAG: GNAT family N-acetyltransferase [Chloroflexota bacterium]|jgi:ribosomal protein S18 acetylase RimI-like enzyme